MLLLCSFASAQSSLTDRIDKYMQAKAELQNFSGSVLLVKNDTIILKKAYGIANREWNIPNTIDTKFRIASNTKQFTAACILQLEEQGKLRLSDNLNKYFPGFEYGDTITLHMLLTHSSGIQDYFHLKEFQGPLVGSHEFKPTFISKDSLLNLLKTKLFDFLPGSDLNYSNSGYFILGMIIEKVSGQTFENYLHSHILEKIGMKNTGVDRYDTVLLKRAKGYNFSSHLPTDRHISNAFDQNYSWDLMFSVGSMYSTIDDLYKWDRALYGNQILNEASKSKMFFPYGYSYNEAKHKANPANTIQGNIDPLFYHTGYGVFVDTFLTKKRVFSRGGTSGFHSTIYRFVNDNSYVIVLQNNEENPDRTAEPLSAILFGSDFEIPYKHIPFKINPQILNKYVGKWVGKVYDATWIVELIVKDNKLYRRTDGFPDIELIPESETKFFYNDNQNKQFEFKLDKKGKVTYANFIVDGILFRRDRIK